MLGLIRRSGFLYRAVTSILLAASILDAVGEAFAGPAPGGGKERVETALQPFKEFMQGFVNWLMGPGKLAIAAAWLVVGFKMVLGMERGGIAGFVIVALIGLAIANADDILHALGIDVKTELGKK